MDAAAKGAAALASKDFPAAVQHYSSAISTNPQAVDYYIKRSTAYTRLSPPNTLLALFDAETAVVLAHRRGKRELIAQAQLRRGVALFTAERWADAGECFAWTKKLTPNEKTLSIWEAKVQDKLKTLTQGDDRAKVNVQQMPDIDIDGVEKAAKAQAQGGQSISTVPSTITSEHTAPGGEAESKSKKESAPVAAQTPAGKIRHDWYQSSEKVTVTILARGVPKDKASIEFATSAVAVSFPLSTGSDFDFSLDPLYSDIDPNTSHFVITPSKVELTLVKSQSGQKWPSLERTGPASEATPSASNISDSGLETQPGAKIPQPISTGPSYPTSSKHGPKDWDKVASSLTKKPKPKGTGNSKSVSESGAIGSSSSSKEVATEEGDEDAYISDEEGDAVNAFFKRLYKDADPDTRRAMLKSYQESNGTALSTNWSEVGKAKVETSPPEGMEAKRWGE